MASLDSIKVELRFKPAPLKGVRHWIAIQLMRLAVRMYSDFIGEIEISDGK